VALTSPSSRLVYVTVTLQLASVTLSTMPLYMPPLSPLMMSQIGFPFKTIFTATISILVVIKEVQGRTYRLRRHLRSGRRCHDSRRTL
jgi:hypothetical protein